MQPQATAALAAARGEKRFKNAGMVPELKRTNLTVEVTGDDDVVLQSYPGALSQIITNLILNSITHAYAPHEVGHLTINIERQDNKVCLHYSDDGKGIPVEHQAGYNLTNIGFEIDGAQRFT